MPRVRSGSWALLSLRLRLRPPEAHDELVSRVFRRGDMWMMGLWPGWELSFGFVYSLLYNEKLTKGCCSVYENTWGILLFPTRITWDLLDCRMNIGFMWVVRVM